MVLESILNPKKAEDRPWYVLILSILFSFIAIFLSYKLFPSQASILAVAFVSMLFIPFFQRLFLLEERKDNIESIKKKKDNIFVRHRQLITVYGAFFVGMIITFSIVFVFYPAVQSSLFSLQIDWFRAQGVTGNSIADTSFERYFMNNSQVMLIAFAFSMLFGAGSVFILSWNASVIAVYLGLVVNKFSATMGITSAYLYGVPIGVSAILLHGIPEITAYFFAAIAGGVLSVGLLREEWMSKPFKEVVKDALIFLIAAEFLIVIAAFLEAYV
ncbi:MAG: stage II sporulation protein M [Candidatus Aenigmarchaeota archaeon]|nr:stage II sporulation protein M [Candidatus Aenigmarchaeota archaeon]